AAVAPTPATNSRREIGRMLTSTSLGSRVSRRTSRDCPSHRELAGRQPDPTESAQGGHYRSFFTRPKGRHDERPPLTSQHALRSRRRESSGVAGPRTERDAVVRQPAPTSSTRGTRAAPTQGDSRTAAAPRRRP